MDDQVWSLQHQQLLQNHFSDQVADTVHSDLYAELWKACADPLMCLPTCGERAYYFPRVHINQLDNSINPELIEQIQISNVPPKVLCRVINVQLMADLDTDEAYAEIVLCPEQDQTESKTVDLCHPEPPRPQFHLFSKVLTASDTNSNWGLCVHRGDAINCFPSLDTTQEQPSQELIAKDIHGFYWCFKHVFRGHKPIRTLTDALQQAILRDICLQKVGKHLLRVRDYLLGTQLSSGENEELRVGVRRVNYQQSCGGLSRTCSQKKQAVVAVTSYALLTQSIFVVHYEARTSQSIITLGKYLESVDDGGSNLIAYYEGEGYQHRSEGSDEQMEEVDGTIYFLPQSTTIRSEADWEGLDDILRISPYPLELDHEGDFEEREEEQREDPPLVLQHPVEESGIQEGSSQVMHISSSIPSQIPYGGPGRGDDKTPWEGYLVAQRCIPTLNRVISRYPDSLLGFKVRSNAFKSMCLEILAEAVYFLEHFAVDSLGGSRDELLDKAKKFLSDLKLSGIKVSWVETRLMQIDEALKMQSLIQRQKELALKFEEACSALGEVEEELGSVNKQLQELSSKVGHNHLATNKPILEGLL